MRKAQILAKIAKITEKVNSQDQEEVGQHLMNLGAE